MTDLPT